MAQAGASGRSKVGPRRYTVARGGSAEWHRDYSRRPLGSTGVQVPLIGYGTAPLGKQEVSQDLAVRCLNHAIDLGVTYLDTSPDYGSEPRVGEVMRTRRNEVFLATKVNRRS